MTMPTTSSHRDRIAARIDAEAAVIAEQFGREDRSGGGARVAWIDDLLPADVFARLSTAFPDPAIMVRLLSRGERKYVMARTGSMAPALGALVGDFASPTVADAIGRALRLGALDPDAELYNGGITVMEPADFMRPHLDNSHDRSGARRRRVVGLFYLSPEWHEAWNGKLKVWRDVAADLSRTVEYRPNRLVLLETSERSWHSVEPIAGPASRVNIATYFYAEDLVPGSARLTRFTGWPGEWWTSRLLEGEFRLRSLGKRIGLRRFVKNRHANLG